MNISKFLSRKFLMALGAIIVDIAIGLGYNLDPDTVATIAGGIAGIYIIVEGTIDAVDRASKKGK